MTFGLLAPALFLDGISARFLKLFDLIGAALFSRQTRLKWLAVSVAAMILFWLFRLPAVLLGDGPSIAINIGSDSVFFKWTELGATCAVYLISRVLPLTGVELGEMSYRLLSVLSGGLTIFFFFAMAEEIGRTAGEKLSCLLFLSIGGWLLLFFGYVENYPVLWPCVAAYIFYALRYLTAKGSILPPVLVLLVAVFLHLQMLFFVISLLPLILAGGWGRNLYRRHRRTIMASTAILGLGGAIIFLRLYHNSMTFHLIIIPLWNGRAPDPQYTLFSPAHLLDMLNLLVMVCPLLPVLALTALMHRNGDKPDRIDHFFLAFAVGGMAFLTLIEPRLGMGRDWDLFALSILGLWLYLVHRNANFSVQHYFPQLATAGIIVMLPFFAANLAYQPSLDRYKALLSLDTPRSRTGITLLRNMLKQAGDTATADSLEQALKSSFPAYAGVPRAYQLIEENRLDAALILADSLLGLDPFSQELYILRSTIYIHQRRTQLAVRDAEEAYRLGKDDYRVLYSLSAAYQAVGRYDDMRRVSREARSLSHDSMIIMESYATEYISLRRYDSAGWYGKQMIRLDSTNATGYMLVGYGAYMAGDTAAARHYLHRSLELNPKASVKTTATALLGKLP
jgi:tetratricopeptide (TPR) repeat protein